MCRTGMMTPTTMKWSLIFSFLLIGHFCQSKRPDQLRDHYIKLMSAEKTEGNITSPYYSRSRSQGFKCSHHFWGKPSERVQLTFREINLRGGGGADDGDQLMIVTSVGKNANTSLSLRPSTTDFLRDPPPSHPSTLKNHHHDHQPSRDHRSTFHAQSIVGAPGYGATNSPIASSLLEQGIYSIMWVYKGQAKPPTLMSSGNHVVITTVMKPWDDGVGTIPGFWLDYKFVTDFGIKGGKQDASEECIFRFNSKQLPSLVTSALKQEKFWSPNHPGPYPFSTDCYYYFTRANDEILTIKFHHLDIDGIPPLCSNESESDFLEFSSPFRERSIRICTSHPEVNIAQSRRSFTFGQLDSSPSPLVSAPGKDGEVVKVRFHSNSRFNAQGFLGDYRYEKSTGLRISFLSANVVMAIILKPVIRF